MGFVFNAGDMKKVYIAQNEKENVCLAAYDLIKDIRSVCCDAVFTDDVNSADIFVCSADNKEFSLISNGEVKFLHEEEFCYCIKNGKLYFFGADDLGAMWAIYSFSENELKIPPFYIFEDIKITKNNRLELVDKIVCDYPHTKFRGWFINDEDLLGGFKSKGKRDIDYAFYRDIIHPDLMDKIVETALRFRINLIIPSTLVDICNPDEENLVKIVSRRGLFVSQHHIEPLGVSHFGFAKFTKTYGFDSLQSFTQNPNAMISCWKHYAEKWSKYPRIVWQVGLRGAGDRPVWDSDKSVGDSVQERGSLISKAIQTQYDIIKEFYKEKIYTTSTVWMEGAKLLQSGYLKLPKSTVSVFADIGMNQLFGEDFFSVPREKNRKYGIYYHSQYWHTGPHLAEGVLPEKIDYCYKLSRENASDYYSVLNVSNVKEFTFSINLNAKLAWYGARKTAKTIIDEYCVLYVGKYAEELKNAINKYYKALGAIDEASFKGFCERFDFNYHKYEDLPFHASTVNDGIVCNFGRNIALNFEDKNDVWQCVLYSDIFAKTIRNGKKIMQQAYCDFASLEEKLSSGYRNALKKQWCWQSFYWINLFSYAEEHCAAVEMYKSGNTKDIASHYEKAAKYLEKIIEEREVLYDGEWVNWFNDERKLNMKELLEICLDEKSKAEKLYNNI